MIIDPSMHQFFVFDDDLFSPIFGPMERVLSRLMPDECRVEIPGTPWPAYKSPFGRITLPDLLGYVRIFWSRNPTEHPERLFADLCRLPETEVLTWVAVHSLFRQ